MACCGRFTRFVVRASALAIERAARRTRLVATSRSRSFSSSSHPVTGHFVLLGKRGCSGRPRAGPLNATAERAGSTKQQEQHQDDRQRNAEQPEQYIPEPAVLVAETLVAWHSLPACAGRVVTASIRTLRMCSRHANARRTMRRCPRSGEPRGFVQDVPCYARKRAARRGRRRTAPAASALARAGPWSRNASPVPDTAQNEEHEHHAERRQGGRIRRHRRHRSPPTTQIPAAVVIPVRPRRATE